MHQTLQTHYKVILVDTDNNPLYIFTGSGWTLVGPEYSDGLLTGAKPVVVTGKDEVLYTILQLEVGGSNCNLFNKNIPPKVQFDLQLLDLD